MPAITARRVAGGLLHGGGVAGAVVVADGDHAQSLSERPLDDRRRRHVVRRAGRERRVHVQVCGADVHAWSPHAQGVEPADDVEGVGRRHEERDALRDGLGAHVVLGAAAAGEDHGRQLGVAGDGDHVEVHLQRHEHAALGGVRQHVAEQVGGVAALDLGLAAAGHLGCEPVRPSSRAISSSFMTCSPPRV